MADRLYLSLWYPNFRLEALPSALTGVLRQFTLVGAKRVSAASAYAIDFTQPPTYQRIYVNSTNTSAEFNPSNSPDTPPEINPTPGESDGIIEAAVAEATEQLHDDMAYEFEMRWQLWSLEAPASAHSLKDDTTPGNDFDDDDFDNPNLDLDAPTDPSTPWRLRAHSVRILGFGPQFDVAGYEQNGHILIDFGLDTPWIFDTPLRNTPTEEAPYEIVEPAPLDEEVQIYIQQNIEKLLAFTLLIEKNCGISSRLLWTESGEPLAEKLIARLQRVN